MAKNMTARKKTTGRSRATTVRTPSKPQSVKAEAASVEETAATSQSVEAETASVKEAASTSQSVEIEKADKATKTSVEETPSKSQSVKTGRTGKVMKASVEENAASTSQSVKTGKTDKAVKVSVEEKEASTSQSVKAGKTDKAVKASARETKRREPTKQESKSAARRDAKGSNSFAKRLRNNTIGRFLYEAYYELRYKVTWPTFREARNMTAVVIALSAVVGLILAAADFGLHRLFLLIIGAQ